MRLPRASLLTSTHSKPTLFFNISNLINTPLVEHHSHPAQSLILTMNECSEFSLSPVQSSKYKRRAKDRAKLRR